MFARLQKWRLADELRRYGQFFKLFFELFFMALRHNEKQVSPLRLKITLLIAGFGPLIAIGIWLQSLGFFS